MYTVCRKTFCGDNVLLGLGRLDDPHPGMSYQMLSAQSHSMSLQIQRLTPKNKTACDERQDKGKVNYHTATH